MGSINLGLLGAGVWMIGTGLGGNPLQSVPQLVKIIGGVICIIGAIFYS